MFFVYISFLKREALKIMVDFDAAMYVMQSIVENVYISQINATRKVNLSLCQKTLLHVTCFCNEYYIICCLSHHKFESDHYVIICEKSAKKIRHCLVSFF